MCLKNAKEVRLHNKFYLKKEIMLRQSAMTVAASSNIFSEINMLYLFNTKTRERKKEFLVDLKETVYFGYLDIFFGYFARIFWCD